jgi:hypothetical protein
MLKYLLPSAKVVNVHGGFLSSTSSGFQEKKGDTPSPKFRRRTELESNLRFLYIILIILET